MVICTPDFFRAQAIYFSHLTLVQMPRNGYTQTPGSTLDHALSKFILVRKQSTSQFLAPHPGAAQRGVAFLPRMCVECEIELKGLCEVPAPELDVAREIRLIYPARRALSHAAQAFLERIKGQQDSDLAGVAQESWEI